MKLTDHPPVSCCVPPKYQRIALDSSKRVLGLDAARPAAATEGVSGRHEPSAERRRCYPVYKLFEKPCPVWRPFQMVIFGGQVFELQAAVGFQLREGIQYLLTVAVPMLRTVREESEYLYLVFGHSIVHCGKSGSNARLVRIERSGLLLLGYQHLHLPPKDVENGVGSIDKFAPRVR